jgi:D-cysteine desulfhydrase
MAELDRRAFLAGTALLLGCGRPSSVVRAHPAPSPPPPPAPSPDVAPAAARDSPAPPGPAPTHAAPTHALFDAYPALAKKLPRIELGCFPSPVEPATSLFADGRVWIKRDDDFSRSASCASSFELARAFGGGKVRKLELYLGDARARGKRRLITSGGVGSNQALAVALLGHALGFSVSVHLAPQPVSTLTTRNLAADAASNAEMRLFDTVGEAHAMALRDAQQLGDAYVIPPGGTTPLGTLGFVSAGLELAEDVRAGRMPAPRRVYVALGLGGTAAGLGIGCAAGGLRTEIVAVRTSSPGSVSAATLRAIHHETIAFLRAGDPSFTAVELADANVRIDGRFVGPGYGIPTREGEDAIARAHDAEGWDLDPVYTGKALAALVDDARRGAEGPLLFWNTMSSRPARVATIPAPFRRFARSENPTSR